MIRHDFMKHFVSAVVLGVVFALMVSTAGHAASMTCQVQTPISAAELNAGATWYFEVFNAQPDTTYGAQISWAGDPSNGGHSNAGIATDSTGYGRSTLPRYWAPDGFLPGYFAFFDSYDPISGFVAVPGDFVVHVGTHGDDSKGKTNCHGETLS
jgi:hypothetical protein